MQIMPLRFAGILGTALLCALSGAAGELRTAAEWMEEAQNSLWDGDFESALEAYSGALEVEPENVDARSGKAYCQYQSGDFSSALASYDTVLERVPEHQESLRGRAVIHLEQGDVNLAFSDFEAADAISPLTPEYYDGSDLLPPSGNSTAHAWLLAGLFLETKGAYHYESLPGFYGKALALDPDYAWAHALRGAAVYWDDSDAAFEDFDAALRLRPNFAWVLAYRAINCYDYYEDEQGQIGELSRAMELAPDVGEWYLQRAMLHADTDDFASAEADYTTYIDNDGSEEAYASRGFCRYRLDNLDGALEDLNIAIAWNSEWSYARYIRALVYLQEGSFEEALADFSEAQELSPSLPWDYDGSDLTPPSGSHGAHAWLYKVLASYGEDLYLDAEECIEACNEAIALDPNYAWAHALRGAERYWNEDHAGAIQDLETATRLNREFAWPYAFRALNIEADAGNTGAQLRLLSEAIARAPDVLDWRYQRTTLYEDLGQYKNAEKDYDFIIEREPDNDEAYANRGYCVKASLGDFNGAIADATKAIEIDPEYAMWYAFRGAIYSDFGHPGEAAADFDKALELEPENAEIYRLRSLARIEQGELRGAFGDMMQAQKYGDETAGDIVYGLGFIFGFFAMILALVLLGIFCVVVLVTIRKIRADRLPPPLPPA